jgi:NTP pyrophosphatase (non-canonical NTP hydrolase)
LCAEFNRKCLFVRSVGGDFMKNLQAFSKDFQREMGWMISDESFEKSRSSLLNNYMLLSTEVAEVAEELRKAFNITYHSIQEGMEENEAFEHAKNQVREDIGKELADCIAYIMKFYNYFEIDAEENFYSKMEEVKNRTNKDVTRRF